MKQLTQTFNEIANSNPNLSSFICFGRACKICTRNRAVVSRGFYKLVDKQDYAKRDGASLINHIFKGLG